MVEETEYLKGWHAGAEWTKAHAIVGEGNSATCKLPDDFVFRGNKYWCGFVEGKTYIMSLKIQEQQEHIPNAIWDFIYKYQDEDGCYKMLAYEFKLSVQKAKDLVFAWALGNKEHFIKSYQL